MDDDPAHIITNQGSLWNYSYPEVLCYGQTISYASTFGASINYTFNGVAIWYDSVPQAISRPTISCRYYGGADPLSAAFTVSIDGSTPQRVEGKRTIGIADQQMLWSNMSLDPGQHTFTLTHNDIEGSLLSLDFFRSVNSEVRR